MKKDIILKKIKKGSYIRTINFHNTPKQNKNNIEDQLKYFSKHFSSVDQDDLDNFFKYKRWFKDKPGLIIAMYNGYRNNYDVIYPLLEKYGFTGWFFIPSAFVNENPKNQIKFANTHTIKLVKKEYKDRRYALNTDEIKLLSKSHVIASHTKTHSIINKFSTVEKIKREIVESKLELEKIINKSITSFCWLGGYQFNYNKKASDYIIKAGYKYMFGNGIIEKIK